jgi:hypothetical protein
VIEKERLFAEEVANDLDISLGSVDQEYKRKDGELRRSDLEYMRIYLKEKCTDIRTTSSHPTFDSDETLAKHGSDRRRDLLLHHPKILAISCFPVRRPVVGRLDVYGLLRCERFRRIVLVLRAYASPFRIRASVLRGSEIRDGIQHQSGDDELADADGRF